MPRLMSRLALGALLLAMVTLAIAGAPLVAAQTATATGTPTGTRTATPTRTPSASATPGTRAPTRTVTLVPGPHTYTVQFGDTLSRIARRFGISLGALMTANSLDLQSIIYVGQILAVPTPIPTNTLPPITLLPGYRTYIVQPGDQLLPIARQFGVTVAQLRTANGLSSDAIFPGQRLVIPPPNPTRTPTPTFGPNTQFYIVQPGDQLLRIARRYGVSLSALRSANNLATDTVRPGQVLIIPTIAPTRTPAPPTRTPTGVWVAYVVRPGDRLSRIAVWYGVTVAAIRSANGLSSDTIRVGQTLTIPSPTRQPIEYVVQPGDTLTRLAERYGTTVLAIQLANAMGDSDTIFAGLKLIIPARR
jgi:LysM repeat protein